MEYLSAAFMGLLQGITEFLPVSSSGHLSLFQNFFNGQAPDALFNVLLHFATLLAVCVVYRADIAALIAIVVVVNIICTGPMYTLLSLGFV